MTAESEIWRVWLSKRGNSISICLPVFLSKILIKFGDLCSLSNNVVTGMLNSMLNCNQKGSGLMGFAWNNQRNAICIYGNLIGFILPCFVFLLTDFLVRVSFSGSGQHSKEASHSIRERPRGGTHVFCCWWWSMLYPSCFDTFFHCFGYVESLKVLVNVLTNK